MKQTTPIAWGIFFLLVSVWGSSFILMKRGIETFTPDQVGALRIAIALLFTLLYGAKHLLRFPWKDGWSLLVVGLLGNGIPYILLPMAVAHIPSGVVGITNALTPLFTLLVGLLFFQRSMRRMQAIGVLVGFLGAVLLINPLSETAEGSLLDAWPYLLMAAVSTLCYGISVNFIGHKLSHMGPIPMTMWAFVIAGVPAIGWLAATDFTQRLTTLPGAWESFAFVAFMGIVGTSVAITLFNHLINLTSPLFATSTTYVVPVVALLWGLMDGEELGLHHAFGLLTILLGVFLVNKKPRQASPDGV